MRQTIMIWTNFKIAELRAKYKRQDRTELKEMDMIELNAFLGLLYYSAVSKSNHESTSLICAADGTGCEIFRCWMSETRFLVLLNCLRFDNPADRAERIKTDKLAAFYGIFDKFIVYSQKLYQLSEYVPIDEMLVEFRGRSHMISYIPQKPRKYGLLIGALCDAKTFYFYNGYLYSKKVAIKKFLVPTQCVLRSTQPLQRTNRNVTADNRFSSIELVDEQSKRNLTYVGTVKKNKREIPNSFQAQKSREIGSTLFGFTNDKTMSSHVPKKNKAVLLISSMHHDSTIDEHTKKPEMILFLILPKGE
ncbi:transposase [Danaus plexippus plexippus]|uniref:Transposase n=1 Tax=Danaus plexippus plexippus TaxID=278856 RepID=A0A212F3Q6_DANPL|nr:transposase [Danaus plexippus plexippus]